MGLALDLAREAGARGEVPVGALFVADDRVVGCGRNACVESHDPTAHAEIVALRDAGRTLRNYRLGAGTLYCTVEPCLMCFGAALHARVDRLVWGAADPKVGATERLEALRRNGAVFNHRLESKGGVRADEAAALLLDFFQGRRGEDRASESVVRGEVPKWT